MRRVLQLAILAAFGPGLFAQIQVTNAKIANAQIIATKQSQFVPLANVTTISNWGFDPDQTSATSIVMDTGWDSVGNVSWKMNGGVPDTCNNGNPCQLWTVASLTGPGNAGWTDLMAPLRTAGSINSEASAGLPWIDPAATGGNHLLFIYQYAADKLYPTVPGGGFTYQLGSCNGLPCTTSNFAGLGTFGNWPTVTSGDAGCIALYGAPCTMDGVLDPKYLVNTDGTTDINHILLTVLESTSVTNYSQFWAAYILTLSWTGTKATITNEFRMTPGPESAWTAQRGSLTNCPRYVKVDGAFGVTFNGSGVPNGGTILWHGDLNTYGSTFSCYTRGMENNQSAAYRTDIDGSVNGTNTMLLSTKGQSGNLILSSAPGRPCAGSDICQANRYSEFPLYLPDVNKIVVGQILTSYELGSLSLAGNMTMDLWVMNPDGSSPYQITNFNAYGSPLFNAYSLCGDLGISNISYDQADKTITVGLAGCQTQASGYSAAVDKVVRINLNYTGNPVYN